MRKLASIQEILEINPIENADAIEVATVLGWKLVVKKNEFKVGDKVVYCEIDSLLPERPEFEFLRKNCYKAPIEGVHRGGFLVKTIKLRKQVSQGICFPLSILPPGTPTNVDEDVSDALGIIKYEPPVSANLRGKVKGNFPSFIQKTDETRIQVLKKYFRIYDGKTFHMTEKLDGSSITIFAVKKDDEIETTVCSRNLALKQEDESSFTETVNKLGILPKLVKAVEEFGYDGLALQGELIGPGIQKNKYVLKETDIRLFNMMDVDPSRPPKHLSFEDMKKISSFIGIEMVPYLGEFVVSEGDTTVDKLVEQSRGKSVLNKNTHREGIVYRMADEEYDYGTGRISFKVINPDFLLKFTD